MKPRVGVCLVGVLSLASAAGLYGQRGGGDWMTVGNDAQRSQWVRGDGKISKATLAKPGFSLQWKYQLSSEARGLQTITPPVLLDFFIGHRGFRTLGFVGSSTGKLTGIDTDLGKQEWERDLGAKRGGGGSAACPDGLTSPVTRPTNAGYPAPVGLRGFGRSTPAQSGVGKPLEGAVTIRNQPAMPPGPPPGAAKPGGRTAPAPNFFERRTQWLNVVGADGKYYSVYVSNGDQPNPGVDFLPAGANVRGLVVYDGVAYAATVNGCGGVENGVWALDIASKKVSQWKAGANLAGTAGFASGPDGTLFAAAGQKLVALEAKTLQQKGAYDAGQALASTPVILDHKGKDLAAVAAADGSLHVVNTADLSKAVAKTAAGKPYEAGMLASWQEEGGTRWILQPAADKVIAWKVVDDGGAVRLEQGWATRALTAPQVMVINEVVFALSTGEFRGGDATLSAAERAKRSSKAVLYALDGATGKELWSSGSTIGSFVHSGGMAAGGGRVYVGGNDGVLYAFGFYMEH